jgi:hypothetical protein
MHCSSLTVVNTKRLSLSFSLFSELRACSACSSAVSRKFWPFPRHSEPSTMATFAQRIPLVAAPTFVCTSESFDHFSITRSTSFSFFFSSLWCVARTAWRAVRVRWSSAVVCLYAFSVACSERFAALVYDGQDIVLLYLFRRVVDPREPGFMELCLPFRISRLLGDSSMHRNKPFVFV